MAEDRVWYVAYGSNTCRDRLTAYLEGTVGPLPGGAGPRDETPPARGVGEPGSRSARYGAHRGCAEATPPADDRWLSVAHRLRFRGRSPRWGGAVAFLDLAPATGVATPVRAWLLTAGQVVGVVAQEARLPADPDPSGLAGLAPGVPWPIGGGWYDTVLRLPDVEGRAAVTVTTAQDLPEGEPTAAYRATIEAGRAELDALGRRAPAPFGDELDGHRVELDALGRAAPPPSGGRLGP